MRWMQQTVLAVGVLCIAPGLVHAFTTFGEEESTFDNCGYSQLNASYTAQRAKYSFAGGCIGINKIMVPWSGQGAYDVETGKVQEKIVLSGPSPWRGTYSISMVCVGPASFDPWLTNGPCTQVQTSAQGEFATGDLRLLKTLDERAANIRRPMTAGFPYNRKSLLAQRQTELQAEVAKAEKEKRLAEKKLQAVTQAPGQYRLALSPIVRSPVAGQRFLNQTAVPIKLGPPEGVTAGGYMVRIERKDPGGNWVAQTTLPVGAAQAASAAGFTGFGAGTPPCCLTVPGAYRLSAQVSSPKPSGWSEWVEFAVMEPATSKNKMLKPPTRSFGK